MKKASLFIGKDVEVVVDRPIGSKHPVYGYSYPINYGFLEGVKAADKEELDAYILGVNNPVNKFKGTCIAVIHRLNDKEDKLIVAPKGKNFEDEEIFQAVKFQERYFKSKIIR